MSRDKSEADMLRELLRADIGAMIESLRTDMNVQFEGVQAQFDEVRADIAKLGFRIDKLDAKLERRTKTLADALAAVGKRVDDHDRRLSRLEKARSR